jgi:hypothetical protein
MLFSVKKKDEIDLQDCEVIMKDKNGFAENNKYMFTLNYKKKGILTSTQKKLILGTDSESSRRDWVFSL